MLPVRKRAMAADVFAICMREKMPSCMRAPPEAEKISDFLVSAFEKPVTADVSSGHMEQACARLADYAPEIERAYGDDTCQTWVLRIGPATAKLAGLGTETPSLARLVDSVGAAVAGRLEQRG